MVETSNEIILSSKELNTPIQGDDVKNGVKGLIVFFNHAKKVMETKGGKIAVLDKLTEVLPFQPPVIDCLCKVKIAYVDMFTDLNAKEEGLKIEEKNILEKIERLHEINKQKLLIDKKRKTISEWLSVIDDYALRVGVKDESVEHVSPGKNTLKFTKTPPKMILDDVNKLPKKFVLLKKEVSNNNDLKAALIKEEEKIKKGGTVKSPIIGAHLDRTLKVGGDLGKIKVK